MQLILIIIIIGGFSYVGYAYGNFYEKKHMFLQNLINFANTLKVQINFNENSLKTIVNNSLKECSKEFSVFLKSYLKALNKEDYITIEILNKQLFSIYIEEKEKDAILSFFNFLGKSDVNTQIQAIESSLIIFNGYLLESNNKKEKYASLFKKLGFLVGVLICIIFL